MKTKFDLAHRSGLPNMSVEGILKWAKAFDSLKEEIAFIEKREHKFSVDEVRHARYSELVVAVLYVSFPEDVAMEWIMRFE
jgi:hypothetical protein